ncbi:monovalent cation/H+ antiporter subunit D [Paraburkholderia caballeronis]|uniref:Multisubunit potassium/proton antiporter, PhaD subunit n=1 Tax=Paraburkholderia caballeronis TaxID=416943 RepID=A0A1H7QE82_9BURK|nr:monovalent cation/H+ antiporter subunit D [Paraburkholderia caballeronis]PXW16409.1 multisubunit potassium/proton antiporter PhaD subunit [Paraburkholderia caballeronis]PXW94086.1 multisubunit potassium/proton antiporter PhaD subunit [Paraburkholderia caballeronis]RAJ89150.1 multisubunit potassium/proton antiporter PhaD subunit [Paraburkholderia caballeronis]SEE09078.1 multisubunit potassium/proton antiporter, PhaD subunit [Paraburkholderia caballeronis]SEL45944.1 multisubunit potassium/pro
MNHGLLLPVLIPLVAAGAMIALPARARRLQHAIHVIATLALLPVAAWLWSRAAAGDIAVYAPGHWPAPFGIVLQLDRLGALMLALTALLACCCTLGTSAVDALRGRHFGPLFQFQLMGLNGAFVAGDLFNLFVFFELLLIASYALLLHGGGRMRVRNGLHYLVLNLAGSSFFLIALGVLYGVTGTLNMADAGERLAQLARDHADTLPLATFAGTMLMLVFGLKAALFPMSFWLPQAYRSAIGPVAALFAVMTKVGVYAMLRCDALVFGAAHGLLDGFMNGWAWWLAIATIGFGALGSLAVQSLKATTGYVVLVSVGLLIAAVSMQSVGAWSALLYYLVSTTLCTAALFLLADVVEAQPQTPEAADELEPRRVLPVAVTAPVFDAGAAAAAAVGTSQPVEPAAASIDTAVAGRPAVAAVTAATGPAAAQPSTAAALLLLFASLGAVGLPPLSGFLGKAMVLAATPLARAPVLWTAVLVSGLLLIVAMSRAGTRILWAIPASFGYANAPPRSPSTLPAPPPASSMKLVACALLLAGVVAITIGAGPLKRYLDATATQLFDRTAYVDAVLHARR